MQNGDATLEDRRSDHLVDPIHRKEHTSRRTSDMVALLDEGATEMRSLFDSACNALKETFDAHGTPTSSRHK